MFLRVRLACVCTLLLTLPVHSLAAVATGSVVDSNVTRVDTLSGNPDTVSESASQSPEALGIAIVACRMGARFAAGNPVQLGGAGLAMCLAGICFELEDFLH
jgi:hypothetical protein